MPANITHAAAIGDDLYVRTADGTIWFWWKGGDRWERDYNSRSFEWRAIR